MSTARAKKDDTMHIRVLGADKSVIEEAASYVGLSASAFMLENSLRAARQTLEESNRIDLSARDAALFLRALENPPNANAALKSAFEEHTRRITKK